jgi:hypothetical protein
MMNWNPFRRPRTVTSSEAGRALAVARHMSERDYFRATAVKLAEHIGRPDLADPLR